jgi:hypothetical protein
MVVDVEDGVVLVRLDDEREMGSFGSFGNVPERGGDSSGIQGPFSCQLATLTSFSNFNIL